MVTLTERLAKRGVFARRAGAKFRRSKWLERAHDEAELQAEAAQASTIDLQRQEMRARHAGNKSRAKRLLAQAKDERRNQRLRERQAAAIYRGLYRRGYD